jgi:hypothetical protein
MYLSLLITSLLTALIFSPTSYSLWTNTLTNLSSYIFTPIPYFFDFAAVLAGVTSILLFVILGKRILVNQEKQTESVLKSRILLILTRIGLIVGIVGSIGSILVGVFSSERAGPNSIFHNSSAVLTFGGLTFSSFFLCLCIILFQTGIPKKFGIFGLFGPLIALGVYTSTLYPLSEWVLFFTILAFLIPLKMWVLKS